MSQADVPSSQSPQRAADHILQHVTLCVARDFRVDPGILTSPRRGGPRVAFARQVAMYLAHVGFALSFASIGRMFGRDRTTVSHACRVVEDRRDENWLDRRLIALEATCRRISEDASSRSVGRPDRIQAGRSR